MKKLPTPDGSLIAGRFQLEKVVGAGGMGTVYRAVDLYSDLPVALKLHRSADETSLLYLAREARLLSSLKHPKIVSYIAHGVTQAGEPYLVMEWLTGEDLAQRLNRAPLLASEAMALAQAAAQALTVAHEAGVVHRDIKPANLFLVNEKPEAVKLIDFGIAREQSQLAVTSVGMVIGTPDYMSPEQVRGTGEIDGQADIFSLGCVLFECLVGRTPFYSEHTMGVFAKILFEPAPRLGELRPDLPVALTELVDTMLAKFPAQRPQSAKEVSTQLARIGLSAADGVPPLLTPPQRLTRQEMRLLCLGVVRFYGRIVSTASTQRAEPEHAALIDKLRSAVAPFRARIEPLPDGTTLIMMEGAEQVEQAAYCAFRVHEVFPTVPIALCLGHSDLAAELLDTQSVERAAELLDDWQNLLNIDERESTAASAAPILVDESLRGLLGVHFTCNTIGTLTLLSQNTLEPELHQSGRIAPFIGRDVELAQLHAALVDCVSESRSTAMLITAEAGMGKSRLGQEFLNQVRERQPTVQVWIGRADPSSTGSAFGLIGQSLKRAAMIRDDEPTLTSRARLQQKIAKHVPAKEQQRILEFTSELLGLSLDHGESPQLLAARREPALMGDQMRRALCDLLAAEGRAQPLLLILEQLQWGDLPTIYLIDAALREQPELPIMVLALARPQVHELFPRLWKERGVQEVRLLPLDRKASERIVSELLPSEIAAGSASALAARAGGNPFFLEELGRAAREGHLTDAPQSVLALLQARILRLDAWARKVLRAASVLGQSFWPGAVAALTGGIDEAGLELNLTGVLGVLAEQQLIDQRRASRFQHEPEYYFRQSLVREAAYTMLTENDRILGHRLAAGFLAVAGETDSLVLAEHLERGGEAQRAIAHYRNVVWEALSGNDFAAALLYAERAIACGAKGEALGELWAMQAEAYQWRAEYAQANAKACIALEHLPTSSARWFRAVEASAIASCRLLDTQQLTALTLQMLELGKQGERSDAYIAAAVRLGLQTYIVGQYELARRMFEQVEGLTSTSAEERPPAIEAMVYIMRANRAAYEWKIDLCADLYERSAELFDQAGDLRSAASQRLDAAIFCSDIAAFARMERLLRSTIVTAERLGLVRLLAVSRNALCNALWRLGRLSEALGVARVARTELAALNDARAEGLSAINLARIHLARREYPAAQQAGEEAVQRLMGIPRFQARALAVLSQVKLAQKLPQEALALGLQGLEILTRLGRLGTDESLVRLVHVQALLALGEVEAARQAIRTAYQNLIAQAAPITTESARQDFLTGLTENAQVLALARELAGPLP